MTHHTHEHEHHNKHEHKHNNETNSPYSFEKQLFTLFDHWITHNKSHANTYTEWSVKAKEQHQLKVSEILEKIAKLTEEINIEMKTAKESVCIKKED